MDNNFGIRLSDEQKKMVESICASDLKARIGTWRVSAETVKGLSDALVAFVSAYKDRVQAEATLNDVLEEGKKVINGDTSDGGINVISRYFAEYQRMKAEAKALNAWQMNVFDRAKKEWDNYQYFINTKGEGDIWHRSVPKDPETLKADAPKLTPMPPELESQYLDALRDLEGASGGFCAWAERMMKANTAAEGAKRGFLEAAKRLLDAKAMYRKAVEKVETTIEEAYAESERRKARERQSIEADELRLAERKKALGMA